MSNIYHNPENAVKRADALLELRKQGEALDCLYDILKNRKYRLLKHTHELIMNKLLEICVERKLSGFVKDGLYAYRIICQDTNIKSWEDAVRKLFLLTECKIEATIKDLQISLSDKNFFDETMTPEKLMKMSCYNEKETQLAQMILLSWIKFTWECYRICVELLKNSHFEKFYHYMIQCAFKFCLKYSRKMAFRKLCHSLRMHANYLQKRHAHLFMDSKNSEITTLYLETGIVELNTALELELWHEAFKITEDIHLMMNIAKHPINSKVLAIYFEKLATLFWKGNNLLFHAAALIQYFLLSKEVRKNFASEISVLSSRIVMAVLSIPFDFDTTVDSVVENNEGVFDKNNNLLTALLNLPNKPTRKLLISYLNQYSILHYSHPEMQNLYHLLENELDPLNMSGRLKKIINIISELNNQISSKQYFSSLFAVSAIRLLSQLSKIYATLSLDKLFSLMSFIEPCLVEKLVVDSARKYNIPVRIDQSTKSLRFHNTFDLFQSQSTITGPECYQLIDNRNTECLSYLLTSLTEVCKLLNPESTKFENEVHAMYLQDEYFINQTTERVRILKRKKLIEQRKDYLENLRLKKEAKQKKLLEEKQMKQEAAEKLRLQKEAEERAKKRRIQEEEKIKRQIIKERIEILKKFEMGEVMEKLELDELSSADPNILLSKQLEYVERGKKNFQSRLHKQERTMNHMERAKRIEEIPLRIQEQEINKIKTRELWDDDQNVRIRRLFEERSRIIENKDRMLAMKNDAEAFMAKVLERRKLEYEKEYSDFLRNIEKEREKRLLERAIQRKAERRRMWLKEKEESEKFIATQYKLVKRDKTRNFIKSDREISAEKTPEFERSPKIRIENNYSTCTLNQTRIIKASNQQTTHPLPIRHDKANIFDNQLVRKHSLYSNNPDKGDERPLKNPQPKYHILKKNENSFTETSKERFLPSWCTSSNARKETLDFQKPFYGSTDNRNSQSTAKQNNASIFSNKGSTTPRIESNSRYTTYSQKYCQAESSKTKGIASGSLFYKRNMDPEYNRDSLGKIFKREEEKDLSTVERKSKYSVRHSCTPWAKLKRENDSKPDNES